MLAERIMGDPVTALTRAFQVCFRRCRKMVVQLAREGRALISRMAAPAAPSSATCVGSLPPSLPGWAHREMALIRLAPSPSHGAVS
jgi:hypothetical protein